MSDASQLLVPVEVDALVVNERARTSMTTARWSMDYHSLDHFQSPEPNPLTNLDRWRNEPPSAVNGVYLQWILPQSLRRGTHDATKEHGRTDFPLVPNRWLVVRYDGATSSPGQPPAKRSAAAWVVESDALDTDGAVYLDPREKKPAPTQIGKKVALKGWSEPGTDYGFLRAVAPGNPAFASYQPTNENVFSIRDPLDGIDGPATLSYLVVGWYATPSQDILQQVDDLAALDWTIAGGSDASEAASGSNAAMPTRSIYHGLVHSVAWTPDGEAPSSAPDPSDLTLSVGSTSAEALTTLIQSQAAAKGKDLSADLLEAFQFGLLPEMGTPGFEQKVAYEAHQHSFHSSAGGYVWEIVDAGDAPSHPASPANGSGDPAWLAALNQAQAKYDAALRVLRSMQRRLYELWWKMKRVDAMLFPPDGVDEKKLKAAFDPQNTDGLLRRVYEQRTTVQSLAQSIPQGETQAGLASSAAAYASSHGLDPHKTLKRTTRRAFWQANNPAILVAGAQSSHIPLGIASLTCRRPSQTVTGVTVGETTVDAAAMGAHLPAPDGLEAVPDVVSPLLTEFFFLDPSNASLVNQYGLDGASSPDAVATAMQDAANDVGTRPDARVVSLAAWTQPWTPLFVSWNVKCYVIPHAQADGSASWTFDGERYTLNASAASSQDVSVTGRSYLTPQSRFTFKRQLEKYLKDHPNPKVQALEDFIADVDGWDFVSLSMDGLSHHLAMRDASATWLPGADDTYTFDGTTVPLRTLLGPSHLAPNPGSQSSVGSSSPFQPQRSAQMRIETFLVADRFGQCVTLKTGQDAPPEPLIPAHMQAKHPVAKKNPKQLIQLAPRALQPGRLDFAFVSSTDDSKIISQHTGVNPVCAWVMPNHLDRSLMAFSPSGETLGEMGVVTNAKGEKVVYWTPAPGGSGPSLPGLQTNYPHLHAFLAQLQAQGPAAFANLLAVVDETLWTTDPLGPRSDPLISVLMGRPLALVRSRLQLQLAGLPLRDPTWANTFDPPVPSFPSYVFQARLGEAALREDGLIGFFAGSTYDRFNAAHVPSSVSSTGYVRKIGDAGTYVDLRFDPDDPPHTSPGPSHTAFTTMLVDPRAAVHAVTGLLPTVTLEVPDRFVTPALSAMTVTFETAPLLSRVRTAASSSTASSTDAPSTDVLMPHPSVQNGTWSWLQREPDGSWSTLGVGAEDARAHLSAESPALRSGYLALRRVVSDE